MMSMSNKLMSIYNSCEYCVKSSIPLVLSRREGHFLRGKPPGKALTLEQRLKKENPVDEELAKVINIGFQQLRSPRSTELKQRLAHLKAIRSDPDFEKKARNNTLEIDLELVKKEHAKSAGQFHLKRIAEHYGIFKDLFGEAFFVPRIPLKIEYEISDCVCSPVYSGNVIKPNEAKNQPNVTFDTLNKKSTGDSYWSLLLTNPDGHFSGKEREYVHWFIANIPNREVSNGDIIVPYLQPFPPKGIGYQRFIFILYKQTKKLNFEEYKVEKINDLEKRTFETLEFYTKYQDDITPAGLAFFQSDWEESLTDFYHKILGMQEPIYEYDFSKPYIKDQKWFPLREPFNLYMDKYRDAKDVNKEYLKLKLDNTHPFEGTKPPLRFPNAHPLKNIPSWQRTEIKKNRLKWGRINDI